MSQGTASGGSLLAALKAQLDGVVGAIQGVNARLDTIEADLKKATENRHEDSLAAVKEKAKLDSEIKDLHRDLKDALAMATEAKAAAEAVKDHDTVSKSTLLWSAAVGVFTLLGSAALMAWWSGLFGG